MKDKVQRVVIVGAGGFGREVLWLCEEANNESPQWDVLGFIDENPETWGKETCGRPVLGGLQWLDNRTRGDVGILFGVGSPAVRKRLTERLAPLGLCFPSVIHPGARHSNFVTVGDGTIVTAGNIITTQVSIGAMVIVNLGCTIGHDVVIEDFCTIAPGCNISGWSKLRTGVELGTRVAIIPGRVVGEWSVIGAGAVVTKDIPSHVTAVGIPARWKE